MRVASFLALSRKINSRANFPYRFFSFREFTRQLCASILLADERRRTQALPVRRTADGRQQHQNYSGKSQADAARHGEVGTDQQRTSLPTLGGRRCARK